MADLPVLGVMQTKNGSVFLSPVYMWSGTKDCVRLNEGMTGNVIIDAFGDREPDYWITDMAPNGTFVKVAEILNVDQETRVSTWNLILYDTTYNYFSFPRRSIMSPFE